jgi:hypothetical protein
MLSGPCVSDVGCDAEVAGELDGMVEGLVEVDQDGAAIGEELEQAVAAGGTSGARWPVRKWASGSAGG